SRKTPTMVVPWSAAAATRLASLLLGPRGWDQAWAWMASASLGSAAGCRWPHPLVGQTHSAFRPCPPWASTRRLPHLGQRAGTGLGLDGFRLFGVGGRLPVAARFGGADPLGLPGLPALGFDQEAAALGAGSRDRLLQHDEASVGVVGAAVEGLAPPGPALHQG